MPFKNHPTIVGYSALLFWSLSAPLVIKIKTLPLFEILSIVFAISFVFSAIKLTWDKKWSQLKQPWFLWLIGFFGIYGNDVLYILSFRHAPAAQVDLINYLWPIMVIIFSGFLPNEKLTKKHLFSALMGFSGIYVLMSGDPGFDRNYIYGYFLALMDAVLWTIYTLCARHYGKTPAEIIGLYCGIGALFSLVTHVRWEATVMPFPEQWCVLVFMGLTTQCLAYFFWDFGIKRGDYKLLTVLSYSNPILSISFLILFGMAKPSTSLAVACSLVSLGGILSIIPIKIFSAKRLKLLF